MLAFFRAQLRSTKDIFLGFQGNGRACILTEPGWAIPYHLFITYASLYMVALGCTEQQVGIVTSVGMLCAMGFSLIGGYVTDRLGRKKTTLIFDLIAWSAATLVWAAARGFAFFMVAAVINSVVRVVYTSWTCLFIEDTSPVQRVFAYSWIYVAGILAGFFAPIAGLLVSRFSLVPTMRGLYLFAFVSMTSMFLIRNRMTHETRVGMQRMVATRDMRLGQSIREYMDAAKVCLRDRTVVVGMGMVIIVNVLQMMRATFLPILLTGDLGLSEGEIAIFPALYSAVMLFVYLFVMPSVSVGNLKTALVYGLVFNTSGYLLLAVSPVRSYAAIIASTILSALGTAISGPVVESILANSIPDDQRAKVMSVFFVVMFGFSSPFGYLGGVLSAISDRLPFAVCVLLLAANAGLLWLFKAVEGRPKGVMP